MNPVRGRQTACAFTGYRPQKLPWTEETDPRCLALKARLRAAIEDACRCEMEHFICGMAQGCDLYFGELVLEVKQDWPEITLEAAMPCPTQADGWPEAERERWQRLLDACDYETMVQDHYSPGCMMRRNRYMVDHAAMLIAVYDGQSGGTQRTVEYALRRQIPVTLVAPVEE